MVNGTDNAMVNGTDNAMDKFDKDYFFGSSSNYKDYGKIDAAKQFSYVISFIKNNPRGGKFLDVGCAFGLLLKEVSPFFKNLYGCDISKYAIEEARKNVKADLRVLSIEKSLPYPSNFFDFVTALDVLEHTKDLEATFSNIVRCIKKGGFLAMSMPIDGTLRKIFGFLDKDKTHISVLPESELLRIIEKYNMKIVKKHYFTPMPIFCRINRIPFEIEFILQKQ